MNRNTLWIIFTILGISFILIGEFINKDLMIISGLIIIVGTLFGDLGKLSSRKRMTLVFGVVIFLYGIYNSIYILHTSNFLQSFSPSSFVIIGILFMVVSRKMDHHHNCDINRGSEKCSSANNNKVCPDCDHRGMHNATCLRCGQGFIFD